jgi:hypothetical protein
MSERWIIYGLLICRNTPEGPVPVRVLLPREEALVRAVIEQHAEPPPALDWIEAVLHLLEAGM